MRHKNWARWWFHFLIDFHPYLGKMNPIWRAYFSNGLVQPPPSGTKSWGLKSACDTACHAVCSSTTGLPRKKPPTWVFGYRVFLYLAEALREQPHETGGILGIPSGQFHVEKTRWMFFLKPSFKRGPTKIIIKPSRLELCSWNFFTVFLGGGFQLKYFLCSSIAGGRWTQFDEHMFQMCWFNHQLVFLFDQLHSVKCWCFGLIHGCIRWHQQSLAWAFKAQHHWCHRKPQRASLRRGFWEGEATRYGISLGVHGNDCKHS